MIIRDLKLDLVLGKQNKIIDKFNEITKDLKVIKTDVYHTNNQEFIFYNENREWIFYQDVKNDNFWCNYKLYWSIFINELGLEYVEIQDITKYLVEETLKLKVVSPINDRFRNRKVVEEALKLKVVTPVCVLDGKINLVEETLKLKVVTPGRSVLKKLVAVEETLKIKK